MQEKSPVILWKCLVRPSRDSRDVLTGAVMKPPTRSTAAFHGPIYDTCDKRSHGFNGAIQNLHSSFARGTMARK